MGEYICLTAVLLLALYGCAQAIGRVALYLCRPCRQTPAVLLLPVSGHREDVEDLVRSTAMRYRWAQDMTGGRILLVDAGMDEETRRLAQAVCERIPQVEFGTAAGLTAGTFQK